MLLRCFQFSARQYFCCATGNWCFSFIPSCKSWRHSVSLDYTSSMVFSLVSTIVIHCLSKGTLPYVGLSPQFSLNGETPMDLWSSLWQVDSAIGIREFKCPWWYCTKFWISYSTNFFGDLGLNSLVRAVICQGFKSDFEVFVESFVDLGNKDTSSIQQYAHHVCMGWNCWQECATFLCQEKEASVLFPTSSFHVDSVCIRESFIF